MSQIRTFKDLAITQPESKGFVGEKVKIKNLIGKEIEVHDYRIGPSQFKGERVDMQIFYAGEKRVTWTGSEGIKETLKLIPKDKFPFKTKIEINDERFQFT